MAPSSFRDFSVIVVSALSFVGFLTLAGFLYEKINAARTREKEDEKTFEKSQQGEEWKSERPRAMDRHESLHEAINDYKGELNSSQIVFLLDLLDQSKEALLEEILVTLSNCCAFTRNQNLVREHGGIDRIINLLEHRNCNVRLRTVQTLSNLSMNLDNQKQIKACIPKVLPKISPRQVGSTSEDEINAILQLLVNMSVVDTWHPDMVDSVEYCLFVLDKEYLSIKVKTNALRLLVNLSCNAENADFFFKEQRLEAIGDLMAHPINDDIILRAVTVITNILKFGFNKTDKTMQETARNVPDKLKTKLLALENCENEEIREKLSWINKVLTEHS